MHENLRRLHAALSGPPLLSKGGPIKVAVCGEHSVQFASDNDCEFFVACYTAVPNLLDEVAALRDTIEVLAGGKLEEMRAEIARLRTEISTSEVKIAMLETSVEAQATARSEAERRARAGAIVARKAVGLVRTISALEAELKAARATNG